MKYLVNILYLDSHLEPDSEETKIVDLLELHRLLDDCDCVIEYIVPYEMSLLEISNVKRAYALEHEEVNMNEELLIDELFDEESLAHVELIDIVNESKDGFPSLNELTEYVMDLSTTNPAYSEFENKTRAKEVAKRIAARLFFITTTK